MKRAERERLRIAVEAILGSNAEAPLKHDAPALTCTLCLAILGSNAEAPLKPGPKGEAVKVPSAILGSNAEAPLKHRRLAGRRVRWRRGDPRQQCRGPVEAAVHALRRQWQQDRSSAAMPRPR